MPVGQTERKTQDRVVKLFQNELEYQYFGNWEERERNSNIEEDWLNRNLAKRGYSDSQRSRAIKQLLDAANKPCEKEKLYRVNQDVYSLLRYGANVKLTAGENAQTIQFIDWKNVEKNDFAIAEEVTIKSNKEKRPDIVLYINGIAIGILELKRSYADIGKGIRQNITNQQERFIRPFFTTIQLLFAGNDTEGLRYGTIETPEKYYLKWKEDIEDNSRNKLDKYLLKMCRKERLLEILYDFVLFDAGVKKVPRVHQYFGIKAAQEHVQKKEGGIIWHTQGSGKSIVMVLLCKWILENLPHARVAIITDRDELDKQIERVFSDAGETIKRSKSGKGLMADLAKPLPRLLCSLVHKFGKRDVENFEQYIKDLKSQASKTVGELFVFVDECHRTQSGKLHKTMKAILPNAVFIGFTGTPLLKKDKKSSMEVFGKYIHTYKFNEGVEDKIILDLIYESRDIDQRLTSQRKVDDWFEAKTKNLNDYQKSLLKKKWGSMQKVLSSRSRMDMIVMDIVHDFGTRPRLNSQKGNAILVASSIYQACKYYELFQRRETGFKDKCAVVTSYTPHHSQLVTEDTGANTDTEKEYVFSVYDELLKDVQAEPKKTKTETYEDWAKNLFRKEPVKMKLLIVVSKLLTGFDAPHCTYLYLDKSMQDHGLFQAICRVNRLDGEDKQFGHIIDYKDLFNQVEDAISVYTEELDYDEFTKEDIDIMLNDRLKKGKERLDNALEELSLLCEPVASPKDPMDYIRYFCGNTEIESSLKATEPQRITLYKKTVALLRAYANIMDEIQAAGYTAKEIEGIKKEIKHYEKLREEIKSASGEKLDVKSYEADMRHLIDTYIQADESETVSPFGDMPLLDIIVKLGIAKGIESMPKGTQKKKEAVAETIENNVRQKIIKDHLIDPAFFEKMSQLLAELIQRRKEQAINYEEYLKRVAELIKTVDNRKTEETPDNIKTNGQIALYNNLGKNEKLAIQVHEAVHEGKRDGWRGDPPKELEIKRELYKVLKDIDEVERIFKIIEEQEEYQ